MNILYVSISNILHEHLHNMLTIYRNKGGDISAQICYVGESFGIPVIFYTSRDGTKHCENCENVMQIVDITTHRVLYPFPPPAPKTTKELSFFWLTDGEEYSVKTSTEGTLRVRFERGHVTLTVRDGDYKNAGISGFVPGRGVVTGTVLLSYFPIIAVTATDFNVPYARSGPDDNLPKELRCFPGTITVTLDNAYPLWAKLTDQDGLSWWTGRHNMFRQRV